MEFKFTFKNFGPIIDADVEIKPLTILCGPNNSGKTYISYAIYGFLNGWTESLPFSKVLGLRKKISEFNKYDLKFDDLENKFNDALSLKAEEFTKSLGEVFNTNEEIFANASISIQAKMTKPKPKKSFEDKFNSKNGEIFTHTYQLHDNFSTIKKGAIYNFKNSSAYLMDRKLNNAIFRNFYKGAFPNPFIITAERLGISLFYKELDMHRNKLVDRLMNYEKAGRKNFDPFDFLEESSSRYATPIQHNIDFVRNLDFIKNKVGDYYKENIGVSKALELLISGNYLIKSGDIIFSDKKSRVRVPLNISSSSVRALSELFFYIKHKAKPGDLLLIDEPESHLSTDNQVKMASLISRLVNTGVKVLLTTHSDYLLKEINNHVMLSSVLKTKPDALKGLKYIEEDALLPSEVSVYEVSKGKVRSCKITNYGMTIPMFDDVVDDLVERAEVLNGLIDLSECH